jgi:type VI secretion system protein ImpA
MPDLERLLAPISEAAPCGEDLSFSDDFDRIREARRNDDPTLAQGEWITELKSANWPEVATQTAKLLETRSKDLQLAVWFAEAAARTQGLSGLALGYRLIAGLCERYWEPLFPALDEGDPEPRIGNLAWLAAGSPGWIASIPIVSARQGRFSKFDFDTARRRASNGDDGAAADGLPALAELDAAKRDTAHTFYRETIDAAEDCREALQAMETAIDARLGVDGPSFNKARDALSDLHNLIRRFASEAGMRDVGEVPVAEDAFPASDAPRAPAMTGGDGVLRSRREALAQLRAVADFFRKTEPHSPVAYLAERAARWGEMPLHDWLKRVVKDDGTLNQLQELLGVEDEDRPH